MKKQQLLSCTVLVPVNLITPHLGTIFAHWQTQRYVNSLHTCLSWWNLSVEPLTYIWVESRKTWRIWWRRRKEGRERQRKAGGWWRPVILILDDQNHLTAAAIWAAGGQTAAHWAAADGPHNHNTWWELHNNATGKIEVCFRCFKHSAGRGAQQVWADQSAALFTVIFWHSLFKNQINSPNITATTNDLDISTGTTEY